MNILKFLESLANENVMRATGSRRDSFDQFGKFGKNMALAAIPFGLAVASNKSYANINPTDATPVGALQLALTLEYLEDEFYKKGLATPGLIPEGRDRNVIELIANHEADHVAFLKGGLQSVGAAVPAKPVFDFTGAKSVDGGGPFDPFTNYTTFLALAQAFEDTGVRAYKGQAGNLISTPAFLTYALQIHSVEARHASEIRRMRNLKGWITGTERGAGIPEQAQAVYDGENVTMQAGYDTAALFGADAGTEAYDEPLTTAQAVAIANLFVV